ncbi:MAG: helix-turn-helix transcriptional regulator [Clostridia bacterium]|nr:helix-turn-helix transcriptional regulator [Clostridia bacterium]
MLADKIILERKKKSWSQEELAERLEVSRQSVSKWEGGLSVPELDKIIAMSALFGVSTDYLLKEEVNEDVREAPRVTETPTVLRTVSLEEAKTYVACVRRMAWRIALGVLLCILSPIPLIELAVFAGVDMLSEGPAMALGLSALFVFVAIAVALFVPSSMRLSAYMYVEKGDFCLQTEAKNRLQEQHSRYSATHRVSITVGCLLCVFAALPLLITACIWGDLEILLVSCVCVLLAIVAVGVFLMVRTSYVNGSYQKLLKTGEYAPESKRRSELLELVSTIYWCVALALYLTLSFLTGAWHLTWIVWVVAAVLSPILDMVVGKKKNP